MGGQVAEELFFGDVSTGPAGDLMYATQVAAQMVGAAGMTDTLVSYAAVQNSGFSDTNLVGRVLGDSEGRRRVEEMLQRQKVVVRGLLEANQHLVAALRDALLDRHELIGREITDVLEAAAAAGRAAPAIGRSASGPSTCARPAETSRSSPTRSLVPGAPRRACPCCWSRAALAGRGGRRCSAPSCTRLEVAAAAGRAAAGLALSAAVFVTSGLLLGRAGAAAAAGGLARHRAAAVLAAARGRPGGAGHGHGLRLAARRDAAGRRALHSRCPTAAAAGRPMIRPWAPRRR